MKTIITKEKRAWHWEVAEKGEIIAGGYCRSKYEALSDASIEVEMIEATRARESGRIVKGDAIRIKPEWQDKGDKDYTFIAYETQLEGMSDIRVRCFRGDLRIGIQSIALNMIDHSTTTTTTV